MRKSHLLLSGVVVATFGYLLSAPATAQDDTPIEQVSPDSTLTPEQQAEYDAWAPDQRYAFDSWPAETKAYYWTLPRERQMMFWKLSDDAKVTLTGMTEEEREAAWRSIESRAPEGNGPS